MIIVSVPQLNLKQIQCIRTVQALMEVGIKVSIDPIHAPTFEYLRSYGFTVDYTTEPTDRVANVTYSHGAPWTQIGDVRKPQIWPYEQVLRCKSLWRHESQRTTKFHFAGLMTRRRIKLLGPWDAIADINPSKNGRHFPVKAWDSEYWERTMPKVQFTLCPGGDYPFEYRFFDAVLTGSIPIVHHANISTYNGYKFHQPMDPKGTYVYSRDEAQYNYDKCVQDITMDPDEILEKV